MLRLEGVEENVWRLDRFRSLADVVEDAGFRAESASPQSSG